MDTTITQYRQLLAQTPSWLTILSHAAQKHLKPANHITTTPTGEIMPTPVNLTALDQHTQLAQWLQTKAAAYSPAQAAKAHNNPRKLAKLASSGAEYNPTIAADTHYLEQTQQQVTTYITGNQPTIYAGTCPACGKPIYTPPNTSLHQCACGNIINTSYTLAKQVSKLGELHITTTPAEASQTIYQQTGITISRKTVSYWIASGKLDAQPVGDGYYTISLASLYTQLSNHTK